MYLNASEVEKVSYEESFLKFMEDVKDCSNDSIRMVQLILAQSLWNKIQGKREVNMDLLTELKRNLVE